MINPITPPREIVEQWASERGYDERDWLYEIHIATRAAQWGALHELEACCEWLENEPDPGHVDLLRSCASALRAARRPKPPEQRSIALQMLGTIERDGHYLPEITETIRRALERLQELEGRE